MQQRSRQGWFVAPVLALLAMSLNGVAVRAQATGGGLDDPTIVAIFDAANTWDIESGALAAKQGTTKEIRDFGAQLERDHTHVRQLGRDLAKKLGVTPTPPEDFAMAKDHATAMRRLRGASRTAFDREFLEHEIAYHKAVIDALNNTFLPAIRNDQLKALVKDVVPAFNAHLQMAQHLLDTLGK